MPKSSPNTTRICSPWTISVVARGLPRRTKATLPVACVPESVLTKAVSVKGDDGSTGVVGPYNPVTVPVVPSVDVWITGTSGATGMPDPDNLRTPEDACAWFTVMVPQ